MQNYSTFPTEAKLTKLLFSGRGFPDIPNDAGIGKMYIRISGAADELENLHQALSERKALIKGGIAMKPWGLKDLTVVDHDDVSAIPCSFSEGFQ